jgi:hyperosmotically inducible periplasmic protein
MNVPAVSPLPEKGPVKRNQAAMHRVIAAAVAAALTGAAAAAAAAAGPEKGMPAYPEFSKLDTNRDGFLSRDETRKIGGFDKAFKEADDNRDGKLDAAEFTKAQAIQDRVRAGQYLDDSVITARVKAALLKDPVVSAFAVSVETHKGVVLLSGFVRNDNQARRAAEIASNVQGVVTVKNALAIRS